MELEDRLVGQCVFVRGAIALDGGGSLPVLALGPICISPDLQRKGYGLLLLDFCLDRAADFGAGAVCLEGNIAFYGKYGFVPASPQGTTGTSECVGSPSAPTNVCIWNLYDRICVCQLFWCIPGRA